MSAYDLIYHGMSPENAEKLRSDIDAILVKSAQSAGEVLTSAIQKAVTEMYDSRVANPWIDILRDCNADAYGFLSSLSSQLWKSMLAAKPLAFAEQNQWRMKELIEAWIAQAPDEVKKIADAALLEQNSKLAEEVRFLREAQERRGLY